MGTEPDLRRREAKEIGLRPRIHERSILRLQRRSAHPLDRVAAVDRGDRVLLPAARLPVARRAHPDLHPVRAVARPHPRLRRHRHARPQRVLRPGRVHRRRAGRAHRRSPIRSRSSPPPPRSSALLGLRDRRGDPAHARAHAADAHARDHRHPARDRQQVDRHDRRRRRAGGREGRSDPRLVPFRHVRQDRVLLLPGDAVHRLVGGAADHLLAVRRDAHRHPRERRRACTPSARRCTGAWC